MTDINELVDMNELSDELLDAVSGGASAKYKRNVMLRYAQMMKRAGMSQDEAIDMLVDRGYVKDDQMRADVSRLLEQNWGKLIG